MSPFHGNPFLVLSLLLQRANDTLTDLFPLYFRPSTSFFRLTRHSTRPCVHATQRYRRRPENGGDLNGSAEGPVLRDLCISEEKQHAGRAATDGNNSVGGWRWMDFIKMSV